MKNSKMYETVIILLTLVPFIYLAIIYGDLPDQVPGHYDTNGNVDRYDSKQTLWILPILLSGMMYLLFKYLPLMDPKKQIEKMGDKYHHIRMALTLFMCALACGIIYTTQHHQDGVASSPDWVFILVGILFIVLGNYMPSMKPNYFVGIRTPWTLENEAVWRKTHRLGAWLFIISGILIILAAILLNMKWAFYTTIGTAIALVFITMIYSYQLFKKETAL